MLIFCNTGYSYMYRITSITYDKGTKVTTLKIDLNVEKYLLDSIGLLGYQLTGEGLSAEG